MTFRPSLQGSFGGRISARAGRAARSSRRRRGARSRSTATLGGFFGETRWNRQSHLFVTAGVRAERIARDTLPGDALVPAGLRQRCRQFRQSQSGRRVVRAVVGRNIHQAARGRGHRHPPTGRVRDRVHRQPRSQAGAQPDCRSRRSIRRLPAGGRRSRRTVLLQPLSTTDRRRRFVSASRADIRPTTSRTHALAASSSRGQRAHRVNAARAGRLQPARGRTPSSTPRSSPSTERDRRRRRSRRRSAAAPAAASAVDRILRSRRAA